MGGLGHVEGAREMILEALRDRFRMLEGFLVERVESNQGRQLLKELLRSAIRWADLEQFKRNLHRALS